MTTKKLYICIYNDNYALGETLDEAYEGILDCASSEDSHHFNWYEANPINVRCEMKLEVVGNK